MSLSAWLRSLRSASTSRWLRRRQLPATCIKPRRSQSGRIRPRLEQLEDRITPTTDVWNGGAGDYNWNTAGNWSAGVPTNTEDVSITSAVAQPINIGPAAYARTLNDTTAQLSIASGGSLTLTAVAASSTFGQNVTVQAGGAITVGAGASVDLNPDVTLTDNGTLTFSGGNNVNFVSSYNNSEHLNVGGLLRATGTSFYNSGSYYNTQFYVGNGGELQANSCSFSVNNLYLDNGSTLNAGDLVNNTFALPLYVPYSEIQNLASNASFQDINILSGTLTGNQPLALNAIGSASPPSLRYVLDGNFTVASGATMTVAPNVNIALSPNVTLTDNGTLTFASGDKVNFISSYNNAEQINVVGTANATAVLNATGASFYNSGNYYNSQIYIGNDGELQANSCGFSVNNLTLDNGSILNPGDLVNNTFALPLYVPYSEIQNLANNAIFQDINILPGTLGSNQTLALNAIGTASPPSLRYVFDGNFTVASGATMTVAPNVNIALPPSVTLTDNGTLTFASGDKVNFISSYNNAEQINVVGTANATAVLNATGVSFYNSGNYYNSLIYVGNDGELQANSCGFSVNNLTLDNGSILNPGDLVNNTFALPLYVP